MRVGNKGDFGINVQPVQVKEYFAQSLEGTVKIDQPFECLTCRQSMQEEFGPVAPRFSAAIGLALRKV